jgi:Spy/CpxP family protein refolding chaperone
MKRLLPVLSLIVAGLVASPSLLAEDKPAGEPGKRPARGAGGPGAGGRLDPAERMKMMTEKLGLTQEQQDKIKAIYEKNGPQFKELMAKGRENLTEDDKTKLRDLFKAQQEQVNAVLTPEQQEKAKEMRPPGGPRGERKPEGEKPPAK